MPAAGKAVHGVPDLPQQRADGGAVDARHRHQQLGHN